MAQTTGRVAVKVGQQTAKVGGKVAVRVGKTAGRQGARAASTAGRQGARAAGSAGRQAGSTGSRAASRARPGGTNTRPGSQGPGRGRSGRGRQRRQKSTKDRLKDELNRDSGGDDGGRSGRDSRRRSKVGRARAAAAGAGEEAKQSWGGSSKPRSYSEVDDVIERRAGRAARRTATLAPRAATAPARFVINSFRPKKLRKRARRILVVVLLVLAFLAIPLFVLTEDDGLSPEVMATLLTGLACDALSEPSQPALTAGPGATGADGTPSVVGAAVLTAAELQAWWRAQGKGEPLSQVEMSELIGLYIDEGGATGVRGDIAFAQAIHETGWFTNTDSRQHNNFAGIGNFSGQSEGYGYDSPRAGVRAHLELLASYADGSGPGQAQTWGEVGNDWSGSDTGGEYWALVDTHFQSMRRHAGAGGQAPAPDATATLPTASGDLPGDMDMEKVLAAIRNIESGSPAGNYQLRNQWGAAGAYQFLAGTWGGHGGYSEAHLAPPGVQDERAREHVRELLVALDGPWDRVVSLGWYLGPGASGARPFMTMPLDDSRWDEPRDGYGTTARQYLEKFQEGYGGISGSVTPSYAGAGGCGRPSAGSSGPCPVQGAKLDDSGDDFGAPREYRNGIHQGIDIWMPRNTPVLAPAAGEVEYSTSTYGGLGYVLEAADGTGYYGAHLEAEGASGQVEAGTVIGYVGTSGTSESPPHLHWEVWPDGYGQGSPVDPQPVFERLCSEASGLVGADGYALPIDAALYTPQYKADGQLNDAVGGDWFAKPHHDYPAADIPVPTGTPIYSVVAGQVVSRADDGRCGWGVTIDGVDGARYTYCHASSVSADIQPGVEVQAGQQIMASGGETGTAGAGTSTGPHLHLGIRVDGVSVCPQNLLVALSQGQAVAVGSLPTSGCFY